MGYSTYVSGDFSLKSKYNNESAWKKIKEIGKQSDMFCDAHFDNARMEMNISGDEWRIYYAHKELLFLKRFFVGDLECSGEEDDDKYRISFEEDGSMTYMQYKRIEGETVPFHPGILGCDKEWAEEEAKELINVLEETEIQTNEEVDTNAELV